MDRIKLVTAPYTFYNVFLPPIALGIISNILLKHGIKHDKDDLFVKLYHAQKNGTIKLDDMRENLQKWKDYIAGNPDDEIENKISMIAGLTNFSDYDTVIFSTTIPGIKDDLTFILESALYRYLKSKYNIKIIANDIHAKEEIKLVDKTVIDIPALLKIFDINEVNFDNIQNLDGFPIELYRHRGIIVAGYVFFNGCPHSCTFCDGFSLDKRKFSLPDPKYCVDNLLAFSEKYGINNFMFLNTAINPNPGFAYDIAKNIIDSGKNIKWCDCATFSGMTCDLLDNLKKAGCIKLTFGFETASRKLQKKINKEIDLSHVETIIKHCYDIGIWVDITLLCGLPYEDYSDLYETLCFVKKNYKYLRGINLNEFVLKDNSEYSNKPESYNIVVRKNPGFQTEFDEMTGLVWKDKLEYTHRIYQEILNSLDVRRTNYVRPVNQIFRALSSNLPISEINRILEERVFDYDTTRLDELIKKYKNIAIEKENNSKKII